MFSLTLALTLVAHAQPTMTDAEFVRFVEGYAALAPDAVAGQMTRMNPAQGQWLHLYPAVGAHMALMVCQGSYAQQMVWAGQSCPMMAAQWQQTMQWGFDPFQNAAAEQQALSIALRCGMGLIDAGSCGAYAGFQGQVNQSYDQTSQVILDNIGGAGCTNYYEQGTNQYMGCW